MFLIIGLGNPEPDYSWTRHNIGFEVINKLAYDHNISLKYMRKLKAHVGSGIITDKKVTIAKPTTYMNLSGQSVIALAAYYNVNINNIIIIHDEIALDVGCLRLKEKGGAGGHNGLKDITAKLNTDEYLRIRIGIGSNPVGFKLSDYVLSKFLKEEHEEILKAIDTATSAVECIVRDSIIIAMNEYNKRNTD